MQASEVGGQDIGDSFTPVQRMRNAHKTSTDATPKYPYSFAHIHKFDASIFKYDQRQKAECSDAVLHFCIE
jgi:hypothetical protein